MREVRELVASGSPDALLVLPWDLRQRSRLRTALDSGEEVGLLLPRGTVLRDGALLRATDGLVIGVRAADEDLSVVHADDPSRLIGIAYHLGNRHVPVAVGPGWLRYQHDPVLDGMVRGLGGRVTRQRLPFDPEPGAYDAHPSPTA